MERNLRKQREGVVTSNKMNKTITVEVLRGVKHPIYGKFVKKSSKITAHDEKNQCKIGDLIAVRERKASKKLAEGNLEFPGLANVPPHHELEKSKMTAKVTGKCDREWVAIEINELLVVEYYSRKV